MQLNVTDILVVGHFEDGRSFIRRTDFHTVLRPGDSLNLNYQLDYDKDDDASHQQQDQLPAHR